MRLSFRLAELHNYTPDPKKRPGIIKTICDHTGLDRHQVAALLRNEVKHIPLDALSRLCDYLIAKGLVPADKLPGALFAVEAEHFWELLARRRRLELCVGVRRGDGDVWPDGAWVVASDSVLMGELLSGVSNLGGSANLRGMAASTSTPASETPTTDVNTASVSPAASVVPASVTPVAGVIPPILTNPRSETLHPESLKQSLVWSPVVGEKGEGGERALQVYTEFVDSPGDKALVCLGTTKSNPVAELVLASAFNLTPYASQDEVAEAGQRGCPIYLRFRPTDPNPGSCWGGRQLSRKEPADKPGIYFEQANGHWRCLPCDGQVNDAAYVFYSYRESQGWLEMAMGGFSGRATRFLARTLMTRTEDFWPPVDVGQGVCIGAFVVQYTFSLGEEQPHDLLRTDLVAQTEITQLDPAVLLRRLNPSRGKPKRPPGSRPK